MSSIVFEAREHYYFIEPGHDKFPEIKKLGMIDVRVFDSQKNIEVAVVSFNENIPKGQLFWKSAADDITYFKDVYHSGKEINNVAYQYLKEKGLNYDL